MNTSQTIDTTREPPIYKKIIDKNGMVRHHLLFSYWIFVWAILYYCVYKLYKTNSHNNIINYLYNNFNPTYALWFALVHNIILLIILLVYFPKIKFLFIFVIMIFVIKVFPLYLLQNTKINPTSNIIITILLFIVYCFYLFLYDTSFYEVYMNIIYIVEYDCKMIMSMLTMLQ